MIIDCHCHFGEGDGVTLPRNTGSLFPRYMRRADEAGIDRTVVFAAFSSDYAVANREVARIVVRYPKRFYGFAYVHSLRDKGRIDGMVGEAVERYGFCGIKAHRHDARITREVCEVARKHSLPVLYDIMGEVGIIRVLVRDYPDVNFIIPHLGSFADDWRAQGPLIDCLARYPNIHTDTAGVRRFDLVAEATRHAPSRVHFGSDGPWLNPKLELEKIFALRLSSHDEESVLSGNFLRLINGTTSQNGSPDNLKPHAFARKLPQSTTGIEGTP